MSVSEIAALKEVRKAFGTREALRGVSLAVHEGEIVGLVGPNGAGKTTAIRCLLGLLKPDAGEALLFGADPYSDSPDSLAARRAVGFMLDEPGHLTNVSAHANLMYWAALYGIKNPARKIDEVLAFVGLEDRANTLVEGFSHGMQQRLALARALLPEPRLLVLDEPTSGLDPTARREFKELMARLAGQGIATLLSSHYLEEVRSAAHTVVVIAGGRVLSSGPAELVLRQDTSVIRIKIRDATPEAIAQLRRLVSSLDCVSDATPVHGALDVTMKEGCDPTQLNKALVEQGVPVRELIRLERSLDEVYESLVSKEGS